MQLTSVFLGKIKKPIWTAYYFLGNDLCQHVLGFERVRRGYINGKRYKQFYYVHTTAFV